MSTARKQHRFKTGQVDKNIAESLGKREASAARKEGLKLLNGKSGPAAGLMVSKTLRQAAVIPIENLMPDPDQPRKKFDAVALSRLAWSLKHRGQIQPIRVRHDAASGKYVILCGERRYRAAKIAGLTELHAVVHEGSLSLADRLAIQLLENCAREDLNAIEKAEAMRALEAQGWTQRQIADETGLHVSSVNRAIALLDLPPKVRDLVAEDRLPAHSAYELIRFREKLKPESLLHLAQAAAEGEWSRKQLMSKARSVFRSETRTSGDECVDGAIDQLSDLEKQIRNATPGVTWHEHGLVGGAKEITAKWTADGVEVTISLPAGCPLSAIEAADRVAEAFGRRYSLAGHFQPGDQVRIHKPGKHLHELEGTIVERSEYTEDELGPHELAVRIPYYEGASTVAPVPADWLRKIRPKDEPVDAKDEASASDSAGFPLVQTAAEALKVAVRMWGDALALSALKTGGGTDRDILAALKGWPAQRVSPAKKGQPWAVSGGPEPRLWFGIAAASWPNPAFATFEGTELARRVRKLVGIPSINEAALKRAGVKVVPVKKGGR